MYHLHVYNFKINVLRKWGDCFVRQFDSCCKEKKLQGQNRYILKIRQNSFIAVERALL